ncbi:hypothetical protein ACEQ3E_001172 [Salmonella enterica]|nr:hypothetical protein [Salmonella enterica]ECC3880487.1 hypothetical protein [Salmonella enterica subsp. diarizonae]EDS4380193.1 hypothetical protein [Salmonella enterica subsp. diarizonae serovar 16:z10:e,n,x,z15]ECJ4779702.1 hypothetical protein [Salmonella enterica subsp. diarizonae]EDQ7405687.1 hypothetical protein [Salmonella enterica subsp. diarizonae]
MKTEITLKNVMILREGRSERRGEISAHTIACIAVNCLDKTVPLTHEGQLIGRIERIYISIKDYPSHAELRGDIVFTDFKGLVALINEERFYPVSVTNKSTGICSTCLDSVFFTTRDDCDFEDQQPIDLSELRELVNAIAKTKESDEGEDVNKGWTDPVKKPYIYAPGMTSNEINRWLDGVILNLRHLNTNKERLQEADEARTELENAAKRSEAFLAEVIRN